jgi:NAD(P)-dependent dehydrogenase (short-subunit alcohol dehydrogenase family)
VNVVTPGGTSAPFWVGVAPTPEALAELEKRFANSIPLGRIGQADEVARTVLFLAPDDASNIQAAEIVIDGGATGAPAGVPMYRK